MPLNPSEPSRSSDSVPERPTSRRTSATTTEDILGYAVYADSMDTLVREVVASVLGSAPRAGWLACLNPHSYAVACDDERFCAALKHASWVLPDGGGIVLASRWFGGRIRKRLCGPDAFVAISAAMNERGPFKVLFLGSTESTLAAVAHRYCTDFPRVTAVDTYSPPFRAVFDEADIGLMRDAIRRSAPDLLWVGLTAPKQELLLQCLGSDSGYRFAAAIGAAFDFYAGNVKRSAPVFRRLGLEWLPRLLQEPRRLWRRTFLSAPRFLSHAAARAVAVRLLGR
jgi:N-acetylglucosaminyldiphosphoundecaprenol N-acetyl-beta-D-mannosaminyltransferase